MEYDEELKKVGQHDPDTTVVTINQFRKTVGADLTYAWFPCNERPTVDVSAFRDGINYLGALTEEWKRCFWSATGRSPRK